MFRQYLIDEIERYQDKESCEAFEQWCEEMEGLKESAFKAALIWIKEIIMERTVEQKAEEHNKYYYK